MDGKRAMRTSGRDRSRGRAPAGDDFDEDFGPEGPRDSLTDVPGGVRLQKVMAAAGVGSRRHCEELIGEGRVEVDGEIVRRYGARVDPEQQIIRVDGRRIAASEKLVYVALNKPAGVLTSMSDPRGRRTIADLLGDRAERLFHVGRLDYETEGLMLLMNDGELAHRLAHPSYGVLKTYLADVPGPLPRDLGRRLMSGIELDDGLAIADKFRVVERQARGRWSRSPCTRAASTSCGGCWPPSATRSAGWCAPRSARSRWARCGRARPGGSRPRRSATCTRPSACSGPARPG